MTLANGFPTYSSSQRTSFTVSSVTQSSLTLCDPMNCSTPGLPVITISQNSLRLMSIEFMMPSSHLILDGPFLLLPPILPSIKVFSNELTLRMRWPKYWSFSFSIIPSKEIPWLISFRMDWLDLLAVQGTLKSLLQHHSSKASILRHSASSLSAIRVVVDISPGNLDSSLCFFQSSVSHDVLCIEVK